MIVVVDDGKLRESKGKVTVKSKKNWGRLSTNSTWGAAGVEKKA